MSRRTPIKDLVAEESTTPSSPVRRSTRIAVRRPSVTDENQEVDKLSVSSTGSQRSISTRGRAASKSPLTLSNEEEQKLSAKRTRRRGSTSSLVEEELETMARSSPVPPKIGRRTSTRSMSCSPITEMENVLKSSTPLKEVRSRRRSTLIEPIIMLESIKEIETKLPKTSISTEETRDEDLPFKKKRAVLMQTISENTPGEVTAHAKVNGDMHLEEPEANDKGDTKKSALTEEKKLVVVLHDISVTDTPPETEPSGAKGSVSDSTEQPKVAEVPMPNSDSAMDTNAEIGDTLEKENVEDVEKRLLNSFEDKEAEVVNTQQSIIDSSFNEPMDVDVTVTPSKVTVRESMDIQEFTQEEVHGNTEKDMSNSRVEKLSTFSGEVSLNTSKESTLKSHKGGTTELPSATPDTPKSKTTSKTIPHEKDVSSSTSEHALTGEEELSENVVESSQKDSPKRFSLEKKLDSPSHKTKLGTPNRESPILVASTTTPLRRSPRLLSHSGIKDSVDSTSSPVETSEEKVSEDTPSSLKDSLDIARSPVNNNREKASEEVAASEDICVKNVVENRSNTGEKHNITFNSTIDLDLDPALKEKISTLTEALEVDSSSDAESVTHYIDDMAEEGEEDTPSEGSNDIIDIGESVGSTASEIDSDESYEVDSFIDDDEEELELLSGEEYDLGKEKPKKASKLKKRIVQIPDSSDEECKKEEETKVIQIADSESETNKAKDDSDIEKMSTRPYCGLSPPVAISIRDSPECDEALQSNRTDEEMCTVNLINKEDNLKSLEEIKEHKKDPVTPEKSVIEKRNETTNMQSDQTPNNSILHDNVSLTESKKRRKSSINIKENVSVREIADGTFGDRILKVVEAFCSTVNQPHEVSSGNVSLNLSLDYISTSPPRENDDETVGRKRVLSESGVDFYQAKKRLSKEHLDSGRLSNSYNKRRSNDPFVVETQNQSPQSPSKKIKINNNEQANGVWNVSLPNKERKSVTETSPNKLDSPQIKCINILQNTVIPEPKRSTSKNEKQSSNVVSDHSMTPSPRKNVSNCEPFIVTEENQPAKETKVTPRKQRNLSNSTNTVYSDIQSMQIVEKKLAKKREKKKSCTNDENIVSSFGTSPNHTFELSRKEDSIASQKSRKKNIKRELMSESEEVFAEPLMSVENANEGNKTKKSKQKRLAESVDLVKEDTEISKKKKSKSKNILELAPVDHEDIREPSHSQKKSKTTDRKKSKPKPASDSEMSDDLDEQIHGKYSKLEKTEGPKSKSKNKKNPPAVSVEYAPEKVSSSEGSWQIEYLPPNVKQALQKLEVKKVTSTTVYRKPKLLPSSNNPQDEWDLDMLNVTPKPTTSKKLPIVTEHHPKDFKGRSTFDSKRVRRMDTRELLKSKEKKKA